MAVNVNGQKLEYLIFKVLDSISNHGCYFLSKGKHQYHNQSVYVCVYIYVACKSITLCCRNNPSDNNMMVRKKIIVLVNWQKIKHIIIYTINPNHIPLDVHIAFSKPPPIANLVIQLKQPQKMTLTNYSESFKTE